MDQNHSVFSDISYFVLQFKTEVENIFRPPNFPKPIKLVGTEASDKKIRTIK